MRDGKNERGQPCAVGRCQACAMHGPVFIMARREWTVYADPRRGDVHEAACARKPGMVVVSVRGRDRDHALVGSGIRDRIAILKQVARGAAKTSTPSLVA